MELTEKNRSTRGKNLSQWHFVHHKSHMDLSGMEPGMGTPFALHTRNTACCFIRMSTLSFTLQEERSLRVFQNVMRNRSGPKYGEVRGCSCSANEHLPSYTRHSTLWLSLAIFLQLWHPDCRISQSPDTLLKGTQSFSYPEAPTAKRTNTD
jgi:hypothetical protein